MSRALLGLRPAREALRMEHANVTGVFVSLLSESVRAVIVIRACVVSTQTRRVCVCVS